MRLKGHVHSKDENLYFLVPAQSKRMQPISVSWGASFRSNLQKSSGPVGVITFTGPVDQYRLFIFNPDLETLFRDLKRPAHSKNENLYS